MRDNIFAGVDTNCNWHQEGVSMNIPLDHGHRYTHIHIYLTSWYRQSSQVSPAHQQLCHVKSKERHRISQSNSIKRERALPQYLRGHLGDQVGNVELLKEGSGAVFAD